MQTLENFARDSRICVGHGQDPIIDISRFSADVPDTFEKTMCFRVNGIAFRQKTRFGILTQFSRAVTAGGVVG
jgi:hypothetical protein